MTEHNNNRNSPKPEKTHYKAHLSAIGNPSDRTEYILDRFSPVDKGFYELPFENMRIEGVVATDSAHFKLTGNLSVKIEVSFDSMLPADEVLSLLLGKFPDYGAVLTVIDPAEHDKVVDILALAASRQLKKTSSDFTKDSTSAVPSAPKHDDEPEIGERVFELTPEDAEILSEFVLTEDDLPDDIGTSDSDDEKKAAKEAKRRADREKGRQIQLRNEQYSRENIKRWAAEIEARREREARESEWKRYDNKTDYQTVGGYTYENATPTPAQHSEPTYEPPSAGAQQSQTYDNPSYTPAETDNNYGRYTDYTEPKSTPYEAPVHPTDYYGARDRKLPFEGEPLHDLPDQYADYSSEKPPVYGQYESKPYENENPSHGQSEEYRYPIYESEHGNTTQPPGQYKDNTPEKSPTYERSEPQDGKTEYSPPHMSEEERRYREYHDEDMRMSEEMHREDIRRRNEQITDAGRERVQRAREYTAFGSHGIDFSGQGEHGSYSGINKVNDAPNADYRRDEGGDYYRPGEQSAHGYSPHHTAGAGSEGERYERERYESKIYEPTHHEAAGYKPEQSTGKTYEPDRYKRERYESERQQSERYKAEQYESAQYKPETYKAPRYMGEQYERRTYEPPRREPPGYKSEQPTGKSYESSRHEGEGYSAHSPREIPHHGEPAKGYNDYYYTPFGVASYTQGYIRNQEESPSVSKHHSHTSEPERRAVSSYTPNGVVTSVYQGDTKVGQGRSTYSPEQKSTPASSPAKHSQVAAVSLGASTAAALGIANQTISAKVDKSVHHAAQGISSAVKTTVSTAKPAMAPAMGKVETPRVIGSAPSSKVSEASAPLRSISSKNPHSLYSAFSSGGSAGSNTAKPKGKAGGPIGGKQGFSLAEIKIRSANAERFGFTVKRMGSHFSTSSERILRTAGFAMSRTLYMDDSGSYPAVNKMYRNVMTVKSCIGAINSVPLQLNRARAAASHGLTRTENVGRYITGKGKKELKRFKPMTPKQMKKDFAHLQKVHSRFLSKKYGNVARVKHINLQIASLESGLMTVKEELATLHRRKISWNKEDRKVFRFLTNEHNQISGDLRKLKLLKADRKRFGKIISEKRLRSDKITKGIRSRAQARYYLTRKAISNMNKSEDAGMRGLAMMTEAATNRWTKSTLKHSLKLNLRAMRAVGRGIGRVGAFAGHKIAVKYQAGSFKTAHKVLGSKPVKAINKASAQFARGVHGGYYKSLRKKLSNVTPNRVKTAVGRAKVGINKVSAFNKRINSRFKKITEPIKKIYNKLIGDPLKAVRKALSALRGALAKVAAAFAVLMVIILIIAQIASLLGSTADTTIMANDVNSEGYVDLSDYIAVYDKADKAKEKELAALQNQKESIDHSTGKKKKENTYRVINTFYPNGQGTNVKEILSMMAVRYEQDFEDNFDSCSAYITNMYNMSHMLTTYTGEPYSCGGCWYRGFNCHDDNEKPSILKKDAGDAPISAHRKKLDEKANHKITAVIDGKTVEAGYSYGCKSKTYKCTTKPTSGASEAWKILYRDYGSKGGCKHHGSTKTRFGNEYKHFVASDCGCDGTKALTHSQSFYVADAEKYTITAYASSGNTWKLVGKKKNEDGELETLTVYKNLGFSAADAGQSQLTLKPLGLNMFSCKFTYGYVCGGYCNGSHKEYYCDGHTGSRDGDVTCRAEHRDLSINYTIVGFNGLFSLDGGASVSGGSSTPAKVSFTQAEFLSVMGPCAAAAYKDTNILASVQLAQAILESGWGKSAIGYNLFGIKADASWSGKTRTVQTTEEVNGQRVKTTAVFRDYNSFNESWLDHGKFLVQNPRYSRVIGEKNYRTACTALQSAGYATASDYASQLIGLIESYNLTTWDKYTGKSPSEPTSSQTNEEEEGLVARTTKTAVILQKGPRNTKIENNVKKGTKLLLVNDDKKHTPMTKTAYVAASNTDDIWVKFKKLTDKGEEKYEYGYIVNGKEFLKLEEKKGSIEWTGWDEFAIDWAHDLRDADWKATYNLDIKNCIADSDFVGGGAGTGYDFSDIVYDDSTANKVQQKISKIAQNSSAYGIAANKGYCQAWVADVYQKAGALKTRSDCARCAGYNFGVSTDWSKIQVGAAVFGYSNSTWGHVGIYVGNGIVAHNIGYVQKQSLESWVKQYKGVCWGWDGGICLDKKYPFKPGLISKHGS